MFKTDTYRLIKKTSKRFFSLLFIVMIGVAFMMGLFSNPTIMRRSVDKYNDRNNLQDIQLYSSYGFCDTDVSRIAFSDGVDKVFASKMKDVYVRKNNDDIITTRVEEIKRDVNKFELYKGRLPEKPNECVVLANMGSENAYGIGDQLTMFLDDEDIYDYFKRSVYTIVGYVKSPAYSSLVLGTSNLNNEDLNLVMYIENENFISDYYSTVYLTLDGAKDKMSYTKSYENFIDNNIGKVEEAALLYQNYHKDKIIREYQSELDENKAEFEKKKAEGQAELDDAKRKLDEANIQLISTEAQIDTLKSLINTTTAKINVYKGMLEDRKNELSISDDDIANAGYSVGSDFYNYINGNYSDNLNSAISAAKTASELGYISQMIEVSEQLLNETKGELYAAQASIKNGRKQYEEGLEEYAEGLLTFNDEIEKAEAKLTKAQQDIDELPDAEWIILDRENHYSSYMYDATCKQMEAIGFSLPILFYLVAALVCMTTMTRLIDEQRGQIGIFRAIGFSKKQIICKYLVYAFLASIVGSIIGIILGQFVFPTVIYNTWRLMYDLPEMEMSFPIVFLLICTLAFSALMMGVTYLILNKSLKEAPSSLMRPKAPKNAKETFIEKIKFIWDRLSFTSKITARNLIRYKSRFFMTVIGVAGCTGLLIIGFGVKDSIADVIEIQFGNIFNYDYQIVLENDHHINENIEILEDDLNNEIVVPFMTYTSKAYFEKDDKAITVEVFDPRDGNYVMGLRETDRKTPLDISNNGIIISEKFAKNNHIKEGDNLIIESRNGIKTEVKVEKICEMYFQHYIFMSDVYYQRTFDEKIHNTYLAIKTNDADALNKDIEQLEDFTSRLDFSSMIEQFEIMIDALDLIIIVIILTAGALAFVVLFNLTQVNISERIREIATLKVLGFNSHEINMYIFKEILILSIIGGLIGIPLGTLEHHFIMNVINMEMVMFGMNISIASYTYSFLITLIFTLIVFFFERKPLKEIKMVESLKSVE